MRPQGEPVADIVPVYRPRTARRRRRFATRLNGQLEDDEKDGSYEERSLAFQNFRRELLGAERAALTQLRNEGRLSDEVRRRVERDLNLEDARLEI